MLTFQRCFFRKFKPIFSSSVLLATLFAGLTSATFAQTPPGGVPIPTYADFGDPYDRFGSEIASDVDWAVITGDSGEAYYVYQKQGLAWVRVQRILPPSLGFHAQGSLHFKGNRLLIGRAFGAGAESWGRVYVYERANSQTPFSLSTTLQADDAEDADRFGYGLSQSADRIFVGANGRTEGTADAQGAAYVFKLIGNVWSQEAKLLQSDATGGDRFGWAIGFDGQDILVAARNNRPDGVATARRGAAYVYRLQGNVWTLMQKLTHLGSTTATGFGYDLAAEDGRAAVAAPFGSGKTVMLMQRNGAGIWVESTRFNGNILDGTGFEAEFPARLAMSATTVAVSTTSAGSAYSVLFHFNGATWQRTAQIARPDAVGAPVGDIGFAGNQMLMGAHYHDASPSAVLQGSVEAFTVNNGVASFNQRIWHGSGNTPDYLGGRVAIDGDWAMVTASGADLPTTNGIDKGQIHFMQRQISGEWTVAQSINGDSILGAMGAAHIFVDLAFLAYPNALSGPRIVVMKRQGNGVWASHCDLIHTAGAILEGNTFVANSAGVVAFFNSANIRRAVHFLLPVSACSAGTELPLPTGGTNPNYTGGRIALHGNLLALPRSATYSEGAPAVTRTRSGIDILEFNAGVWSTVQTLNTTGAVGALADVFFGPHIEDDKLALIQQVRVNPLTLRSDIALFTRNAGVFTLSQNITANTLTRGFSEPQISGGQVLALDQALGLNGGVAIFDFATGSRLQDFAFSAVGLEEYGPTSLNISGNRAIVGWPYQDREGSNNAGMVYTIEQTSMRGPLPTWTINPMDNAPRPDRLFEHFFEQVQ